jgi:hypothetical protein
MGYWHNFRKETGNPQFAAILCLNWGIWGKFPVGFLRHKLKDEIGHSTPTVYWTLKCHRRLRRLGRATQAPVTSPGPPPPASPGPGQPPRSRTAVGVPVPAESVVGETRMAPIDAASESPAGAVTVPPPAWKAVATAPVAPTLHPNASGCVRGRLPPLTRGAPLGFMVSMRILGPCIADSPEAGSLLSARNETMNRSLALNRSEIA